MSFLRIIGDMHCEPKLYLSFIKDAPYSIQVGDFDVAYEWLEDNLVDPTRHKFFTGNHDHMDRAAKSPYNMGDFGVYTIPELGDVFFVRGAYSIDSAARFEHDMKIGRHFYPKDYWPDCEQLNLQQGRACLELYKEVHPNVVLSHEAPYSVVPLVTDPKLAHEFGFKQTVISTNTNGLLELMFEAHQPKMHVFGHYHRPFDQTIKGTRFVCAPMYRYIDIPEDFLKMKGVTFESHCVL